MDISSEARQTISTVGKESLEIITEVATAAQHELDGNVGTNVFVNPGNPLTGNKPAITLSKINSEKAERLKRLRKEPVIARIVVKTEDEELEVYYISRAAPIMLPNSSAHFASYGAPLGRLASIPSGEEVTIQTPGKIKVFEVVEKTQLIPRFDREWDSCDNVIDSYEYGVHTVSSFRSFLAEELQITDTEDVLSKILGEDESSASIIVGRRRRVVDRMQLRDQPILDQYQDAIFRLPLDNQLLITGPPGTGKTTTLIRRLGQKLEQDFLLAEEQDLLRSVVRLDSLPHEQSWVMFSPTELLKLYVKEAFNREGIPAPEQRIRTWSDERRHLARNVLGILRTSTGGKFSLDEYMSILHQSTINDTNGWYDDFEDFFLNDLLVRLQNTVEWLTDVDDEKVSKITAQANKSVSKINSADKSDSSVVCFENILALSRFSSDIDSIVKTYNDELREIIKGWLNSILRSERDFLNRLAGYLETIKDMGNEDLGEDEDEEDDIEDDTLVQASSIQLGNAQKGYIAAMRALAKAKLSKRQPRLNTRAAKVITWLENRLPPDNELLQLGEKIAVVSRLRQLANPIKSYVAQVPVRYQAFRRLRMAEGKWYQNNEDSVSALRRRALHGLEVDLIILVMLRHAGKLHNRLQPRDFENNAKYAFLNNIYAEYRHQVLVDEATDFSPVQLACMVELSHPRIRSFFACGDLHQRVTSWGARDHKQIKWVSDKIEIRPVSVAYRQSQQLTDLAARIALLNQEVIDNISLPDRIDNEGEPPVLAENLAENELADWLGKRIVEVEQRIGKLPSIAVFVDGEPSVEPLTSRLAAALTEYNINVVSCPQGRVMGQDGDVRVFDVQHIKGLEFEAVFFVGIDSLAERETDLFNKFLYVGATRAATYLGLTCVERLPEVMDGLRKCFVCDWS